MYGLIPASCFPFLCLITLNISIDHEQHLLIHELGQGCTVTQHQNTKHLVLLSVSPPTQTRFTHEKLGGTLRMRIKVLAYIMLCEPIQSVTLKFS